MKYYISDPHFYHRYCEDMDHRGFETMFEMHEYMIEQWNSRISDDDEVFVIGDFSFGRGIETWKVLSQLKGRISLVEGNHDGWYLDDAEFTDTFENVAVYYEIKDRDREVILCHYPMPFYNHQYHMDREGKPLTYMLYGHVHNTHDERLINRFIMETRETKVTSKYVAEPQPIPCNMINCFCMFSDYKPLTLSEWIDVDRKRRAEQPDRRIDNGTSRADNE
jgi:calcineurin-like phosphoesterase family protein